MSGAGPSSPSSSDLTPRPQLHSDLRDFSGRLVLVGAGNMGAALLQGWLRLGLDPNKLAVIEPQPLPHIAALTGQGVQLNPDAGALRETNVAVIAVKPQTAVEALSPLASNLSPSTLVISIMAGRTLRFLASALPQVKALVRAMPNTPAAIGRGMTVAVASQADTAQRQRAHQLLGAIGAVEWVADEALMDAVTAVSGSGPAYVFLLAEALTQAGTSVGLPAVLAEKLAHETIAGSGELLHRSRENAATLRQNVTSPGGTTAAALAILMRPNGLVRLMAEAIAAATARSRELAG